MIPISVVVGILVSHYISDFLMQTSWMALGKSKRLLPLIAHIFMYITIMTFLTTFYINPVFSILALKWMALNGLTHFFIDFITSRIGSKLWAKQKTTYFFWNLGFDQLLHYVILFLTYYWMF